MTRTLFSTFAALLFVLASAQAQTLTAVDTRVDNESPDTDFTANETHLDSVEGMAVSADGRHLYATADSEDAFSVFSIAGDGSLSLVEVHADNGAVEASGAPISQTHLNAVAAVVISPDDLHVYTAAGLDGGLTVFSRNGTSGALTLVEVHEDDDSPEAGGSPIAQTHIDSIDTLAISPDGKHLYVPCDADDALTVFSRNPTTGALTLVAVYEDNESSETDGSPAAIFTHLDNPTGVQVSPDGDHVYLSSGSDEAVNVFARNSTTGLLTLVEVHADSESVEAGGSPISQTHLDGTDALAIRPSGTQVYLVSDSDDAVTVFDRNPTTGALTLREVHEDPSSPETGGSPIATAGLDGAKGITASDSHVAVTAGTADALVLFTIDGDGGLTLATTKLDSATPAALDNATSVVFSPDGNVVWVGSGTDDAITAYAASTPVPVELLELSIE